MRSRSASIVRCWKAISGRKLFGRKMTRSRDESSRQLSISSTLTMVVGKKFIASQRSRGFLVRRSPLALFVAVTIAAGWLASSGRVSANFLTAPTVKSALCPSRRFSNFSDFQKCIFFVSTIFLLLFFVDAAMCVKSVCNIVFTMRSFRSAGSRILLVFYFFFVRPLFVLT